MPSECTPHTISRIRPDEIGSMRRNTRRIRAALESAGFSFAEIDNALQSDINESSRRKSAASPYESLRAAEIARLATREIHGDWLMVSVGDPRHRLPVGALEHYDPAPILRRFRASCDLIEAEGYAVCGFAFVEVHLCVPLKGDPFWEPHAHALICNAPPDAVRAAFRVRPSASTTLRKRSTRVDTITDLDGAVGYVLKTKASATVEYLRDNGEAGWGNNDLRGDQLSEWASWMAKFRVSQLLTSRRLDLTALPRNRCFELATPPGVDGRLLP